MRRTLLLSSLLALLSPAALAQDPCGDWSVVPIPNPPTSTHTVVEDVVSIAPDDAWAVGRQYVPVPGGSETQTLAYHWDGASWTIVPTPSPSPYPGGGWAELLAVEAVGADDVWAAGDARVVGPDGFVGTHLLVLRWNGSQWSVVPSPQTVGGSGNFVDDIEIVSPSEIWFVGDWLEFPPTSVAEKRALAMRWNGSSFQVLPTPFFNNASIGGHGLTAISASSASDVWAVGGGHDGDYVDFSYIVRWNGSQWQYVPGPTAGWFHRLYDVHAVASNDVYAIGDYQDASGYHGMFLHWNGSSWTRLPDPPVGGAALEAFAPDRVYAAGGGIALWDASNWSVVETFPGVVGPSVLSLEPIGPCSLWGAGRQLGGNQLLPLSVRLDASLPTQSYCTTSPNSVGAGSLMGSSGSTSVAAADFVLRETGAPPFRSGIFFYGAQQVSAPFGNGVRCAGGSTVRLPVLQTDASGAAAQPLAYANGPIDPGETWNFQFWYRDPIPGGASFNLSDGLEVHFVP
jgi:hypothetical protein